MKITGVQEKIDAYRIIQAIVGLNAGVAKREDPAKNAGDMLNEL